ncbi:phage protein Gp27 family protein [Citrobacter braakii]|uniref:phage protein Gp27 family protein n=1 Tax=Citrobacter braakii TaxID=57706 RepID=UPI004039E845
MARRSKIDMFGLVERVLGLYQRDKKTIKEIAAELKADGFDVSYGAVQRTIKSNEEIALQMRRAAEDTKLLLAEARDNPGTDLVEVGQQILATKLLEVIKSVDDLHFEDAGDLVEALASLSRAQVNVGRLRLEFSTGVDAAKAAIENKLTELLADDYPDLLRQLLDALAGIEITKQDLQRAKKSL